MSLRACEKCGTGFIPQGAWARFCGPCSEKENAPGGAKCPKLDHPYRAPAGFGHGQTPETMIERALEGVRIIQGNPHGATVGELQAVGLLRIANVLEEWRARGFK